jgi:monofunctional biosynthetic peptidoglycan transglycosylase
MDMAALSRTRRRLLLIAILLSILVAWFVPFVPALYFNTITVTRLDAKGKVINVDVGPGTKQWISIEHVSRHIVNAIVVAEDGKFYSHHGFDFEAIQKAIDLNRKKGRYVRGASTISQQVIKMTFLSREKTIVRKLREAAGTVLMEIMLPKDKIIEWYINLCEFGGGIYGVKSAGMYYFKTRPELLTIEQAAHLALVIPSPNKWSKGLRAKSLTPFGQRRFARIVTNLFLAGYITEVQKATALARGNFGNPIAGYGSADDDDDCHGDRECEDVGSAEKQADKSLASPADNGGEKPGPRTEILPAQPANGKSPAAAPPPVPAREPPGAQPASPAESVKPAESAPGQEGNPG